MTQNVTPASPDDLDEFRSAYPKTARTSWKQAEACWHGLTRAERTAAILGARNYAASRDVAGGFAKGAQAWLRGRFWEGWQEPEVVLPPAAGGQGRGKTDLYAGIREWSSKMDELYGPEDDEPAGPAFAESLEAFS